MAGISELLLLPPPDDEEEDEIETLDPMHCSWMQYVDRPIHPFFPESPHSQPSDPSLHHPILIDTDSEDEVIDADIEIRDFEDSDSNSGSNFFDREEVNIALDLFNRSNNHQTHLSNDRMSSNPFSDSNSGSDFRVFEENLEMGSNFLELGLGFGIDDCNGDDGDGSEICNGMDGDGDGSGDGFFVGNSGSESGESCEVCAFEAEEGLGIAVGFGSDSDSDDVRVAPIDLNSDGGNTPDRASEDLGLLPLCWDCLRLEDRRDPIEDFEWEEVDRRSFVDEREAMNMEIETAINMAFEASIDEEQSIQEIDDDNVVDWEVLLAVNNLEHFDRNTIEHEMESYVVDHDDYIYTTEYEVLFGQFAEAENSIRGNPPAAKSIVENLPSVFLTKEDVESNNALCAVCKDEISLEERAKRLPCAHHYHGDCILPWLGIRNTCPVCRFELPTDDPDYEHWRSQRAAQVTLHEGSLVRYDLEMLPEAE